MDVLTGMRAFRAVATHSGFAAAARTLSVSTAGVSKSVKQLEQHLGAQLLVRTTRRVVLTDAGRSYLERCAQLLDELDELERSLGTLREAPRGRLRVSAPMSFGLARIAPLLSRFARQYPEVELELELNDRAVDLVHERFDLAIRVGAALDDSTLRVKRLASGTRVLSASPSYLRAHGAPKHPSELADHACLRYAHHRKPSQWTFHGPDQQITSVSVSGPLQANNSLLLKQAAVAGAGILLAPDFISDEELRDGRLRALLPEHHASGYHVYALSPPARHPTAKARAFITFLTRALAR